MIGFEHHVMHFRIGNRHKEIIGLRLSNRSRESVQKKMS